MDFKREEMSTNNPADLGDANAESISEHQKQQEVNGETPSATDTEIASQDEQQMNRTDSEVHREPKKIPLSGCTNFAANLGCERIKFNPNLDIHTVETNFLRENIIERKPTFTNEEIEFFIKVMNKELDDMGGSENQGNQAEGFLESVQRKYGTLPEQSKKKPKQNKGKVAKKELEIITPELSEEAEERYHRILEDMERLKNSNFLYKHDPITSYFAANTSLAANSRSKEYKHNPGLLDMPVIINNSVFKEMEKKLVTENLDPYLDTVLLQEFRSEYYKFFLEILAGKTPIFYGLGYKKKFVDDFGEYLSNELQQYYNIDSPVPICEINGIDVPNRYNTLYNRFRNHIAVPAKILTEFEHKIDKRDRQLWGDHALDELELLEAYYKYSTGTPAGNIRVILTIHNVDGEMFRKPSFKKFVAAVAKVPAIALVLTAYHVRFPINFEKNLIDMIKPSYHVLHTLKPFPLEGYINQNDRDRFFSYFDVLKADGAVPKKKIGKVSSSTKGPSVYDQESGLNSIFKSLTKRNLRIFKLLVHTLLERMKAQKGVTKAKLYRIPLREFLALCQKEFLVSDEVALRKGLSEFVDHSLCSLGDKNRMGIEFLDSGYSEGELEHMLNNQLRDLEKYV